MTLANVRGWFEQRKVMRERVAAAEEFAWVWSDTVNTDAYAYGASLECNEAQALARLFTACNFFNTAADLLAEHATVCQHDEPHNAPTDIETNGAVENAA